MTTRKPEPIRIQGVTATTMDSRGLDEQGRPYWRARGPSPHRVPVWAGWGTRAEAEAAVLVALRRGIRHPGRSVGAVRSIDDLLVQWSRAQGDRYEASQIALSTLERSRGCVAHLRAALGSLPIGDLSVAVVEDAVLVWQAEAAAARTVALVVRTFRAAVKWGARRGLCDDVPVLEAAPDVRDDEHVNYAGIPLRVDVEAAIGVLSASPARDAVEVLSLTGARVGEVAALVVSDFDRQARTLRLWGRDERRDRRGKTAPRLWPVAGELGAVLERLAVGRPLEAPLLDLPTAANQAVWAACARGCDLASVERFSPHGLRRMVVCELLEHSNVKEVARLTGHTVEVLLRHYVRPDAEQLRAAVERVQWRGGKVRRLRRRA